MNRSGILNVFLTPFTSAITLTPLKWRVSDQILNLKHVSHRCPEATTNAPRLCATQSRCHLAARLTAPRSGAVPGSARGGLGLRPESTATSENRYSQPAPGHAAALGPGACRGLESSSHVRALPIFHSDLALSGLARRRRSGFRRLRAGTRSCGPGPPVYDYRGRGTPSHRLGRIHPYVRSCSATGTDRERSGWRT